MTKAEQSKIDSRFVQFVSTFGLRLNSGTIACSWEAYTPRLVDMDYLRLVAICMLLEKNSTWKRFYMRLMLGDSVRIDVFAKQQQSVFNRQLESLRSSYWQRFYHDEGVLISGDASPIGGVVLRSSQEGELQYDSGADVYQIVDTGIHCIDGERVMIMAEEGDETALNWLDYCEWVADKRRNK